MGIPVNEPLYGLQSFLEINIFLSNCYVPVALIDITSMQGKRRTEAQPCGAYILIENKNLYYCFSHLLLHNHCLRVPVGQGSGSIFAA